MSDEQPNIEEMPETPATEEATSDVAETPETPTEDASEEGTADETAVEVEEVSAPHRDIKPGMVVRVHEVIKDTNAKGEERERVQIFEGTVLGLTGEGISRTMTVRKVSGGIGVEKIYPLASPHVSKIEVVKAYRTRRSKLWFLRRGFKRKMKEVK